MAHCSSVATWDGRSRARATPGDDRNVRNASLRPRSSDRNGYKAFFRTNPAEMPQGRDEAEGFGLYKDPIAQRDSDRRGLQSLSRQNYRQFAGESYRGRPRFVLNSLPQFGIKNLFFFAAAGPHGPRHLTHPHTQLTAIFPL